MDKRRFSIGLLFLISLLAGWGGLLNSHGQPLPSENKPGPGKIFVYTAKKLGVPVIQASIKIENGVSEEGLSLYQLHASIHSHFGILFRMNNQFFSTVRADTCAPVRYAKEIDQKGLLIKKKKYSQTFLFDLANEKVIREIGTEGEEKEFSLTSEAYDPLSMFAKYYLKEEIIPGQEIQMSIFDGFKLREMVFTPKKDKINSKMYGEIETICLESSTSFSSFEDKGGIIRIWYTNNGEKVPVLIELELPVGTVRFELESIENI